MKREIWKDVIGFEGYYQISNLGRVKSLVRLGNRIEKILKPYKNNNNFYFVDLKIGCNRKQYRLHRLVADHFIPQPFNKQYVSHIDGNRANNKIKNLEWLNGIENACHGIKLKGSSSRYTGVHRSGNKWRAQICHKGRYINLGTYKTQKAAYAARVKYERDNRVINKYL